MPQFFFSHDGTTRAGPVEHDALVALARSGMLPPTALIWREGYPNWIPASLTPELAALFANPAPALAPDAADAPDAAIPPDPTHQGTADFTPPTMPGPMGLPRVTAADGFAIAALIFGIASIVLLACINFLGLPLPIVGLVLAKLSKSPGGVRTAAFIVNAVGVALLLGFLAFVLAM